MIYEEADYNLHDDDINLDADDGLQITKFAPPLSGWFHGKMSREDAAALLTSEIPGSFLVRESTNTVGDFSISFRVPAGVKHFKIIAHEYGDFFIADKRFATLHALVEHYYNTYLCDNMYLEHAVKPTGAVHSLSVSRRYVAALYDYNSTGPNELSFVQGDRFAVINDEDQHWLWVNALRTDEDGFVPRSLVESIVVTEDNSLPPGHERVKWLHGEISREEAASLLEASLRDVVRYSRILIDALDGTVGFYLVRPSQSNFSLSFMFVP